MSAEPSGPVRRLPDVLAEAVLILLAWPEYEGFTFEFVGRPPPGSRLTELHIPCAAPRDKPPAPGSPPRPADDDGTIRRCVLEVLEAATEPMTAGALSDKATGSPTPSGRFRRVLKALVADGTVAELGSGRALTYELG